ncbi:hypothetical protein [Flammeovirga sp. EKP202]|uniref:hypothetical protein n=1 Tax=Flammeovirga sp. EKP202 TaxID=2770592 RepID=UPI00165F5426|nr:hypothetical protein [Flammeovirga sp. EKP202]MBD0403905.1 hypothetical protein [Flammeovirga sp. EKP202]
MAHKKKGLLTTSPEWAKHLRKYMKNQFWKGERNASKELIRNELFETDNLLWQFEEMIKTLIALSLSLKEQINFYGVGATADEMLEDFYSYYVLNKNRFLERELITKESMVILDDIDSLTDSWSDEKEEEFWFEMEKHQNEWNILREKALFVLKLLKKDNLTVEVKHENELDEKGNIIIQRTTTELKEK